jgi:hypothetical protein
MELFPFTVLIKYNADVNKITRNGTALTMAIAGNRAGVRILAESGAVAERIAFDKYMERGTIKDGIVKALALGISSDELNLKDGKRDAYAAWICQAKIW